jgi:hypothetical protein
LSPAFKAIKGNPKRSIWGGLASAAKQQPNVLFAELLGHGP